LNRLLSRHLSISHHFFIVAALVLISPLEFGVLLEPDLPVSDIVFCLDNLIITLLFILFLFLILFIVQVVFMDVLHGLELLLISKAASLDLLVQVLRLVNVARQLGHTLELEAKTLRKEVLDAHHIAREVILGVRVRCRGHLREIDDCDVLIIIYQQVEFVEISVDEAMLCQPDNLL
jgi:hypothetical protein